MEIIEEKIRRYAEKLVSVFCVWVCSTSCIKDVI